MKCWTITTLFHLIISVASAQNDECGFKTECLCDTLKETVINSFEISDCVFQGKVIGIDTLSIAKIITNESILKINQDPFDRSECAKHVLKTEKVLRVKIRVNKSFKGLSQQQKIYVIRVY
ncbi:hypothetical protein FUAX_01620 [Fulvitalea axinellae]|uniref:Uncharacterized protein n=1 Tax=Fulvitalea axinellae TaxID=1182444 RepID=A0AAU9CEG4_9BACT|nr:hypothetical protein FUAX_01620 [Fulvitalea axinellae]